MWKVYVYVCGKFVCREHIWIVVCVCVERECICVDSVCAYVCGEYVCVCGESL